jgi:amino acid transporter
VLAVTIAVGIQTRPADAPQTGAWVSDYKIINSPSFSSAATALSTIVFAYAGTPAFFSIASEMRDPRNYGRSLVLCQTVVTAFYVAVGIVVYYYCGSYVSSPALGSAGPTMRKVSYGIALPGLLISTLLFVHVSSSQWSK